MALVGETTHFCDRLQFMLGRKQKFLCAGDLTVEEEMLRRDSQQLGKTAMKVERT